MIGAIDFIRAKQAVCKHYKNNKQEKCPLAYYCNKEELDRFEVPEYAGKALYIEQQLREEK